MLFCRHTTILHWLIMSLHTYPNVYLMERNVFLHERTLGNNNDFIRISCYGGRARIPKLLQIPPPTPFRCIINHRVWMYAALAPTPRHWHLLTTVAMSRKMSRNFLLHSYVCVRFGISAPTEYLLLSYIITKSGNYINILVPYCMNYSRY